MKREKTEIKKKKNTIEKGVYVSKYMFGMPIVCIN